MNLLDVNLVVALFRDDHPHHARALAWWVGARPDDSFTVPDVVWSGFLRIVTHPRITAVPATVAQAWSFVEAVRAQGGYLDFVSHPRTLDELGAICRRDAVSGDLVTDAHIAACAVTLGATVVTFDRDFRKLDGVRVLEPA